MFLEYFDDVTRADSYETGYNYGALKAIYAGSETVTKYEYSLNTETGTGNSTLNFTYDIGNTSTGPEIHGSRGVILHSGTYDNGKEYILDQGGNEKDRIWLYTFDGHAWIVDPTFVCQLYGGTFEKDIYTFNNTIVYKTPGRTSDPIKLIFWADNRWCVDDIAFGQNDVKIDEVHIGNDFIVFRGGDGEHNQDRIWIYRRYGAEPHISFKLIKVKQHVKA